MHLAFAGVVLERVCADGFDAVVHYRVGVEKPVAVEHEVGNGGASRR